MGMLCSCCGTRDKRNDDSFETEFSELSKELEQIEMNEKIGKKKKKRRLSIDYTIDKKIKKRFRDELDSPSPKRIIKKKSNEDKNQNGKLEIHNNVIVIQKKIPRTNRIKKNTTNVNIPILKNLM